MTWIGRSSHCASSIATHRRAEQAESAVLADRLRARFSSSLAHEQRRDADADRAEVALAEQQRLADLERRVPGR